MVSHDWTCENRQIAGTLPNGFQRSGRLWVTHRAGGLLAKRCPKHLKASDARSFITLVSWMCKSSQVFCVWMDCLERNRSIMACFVKKSRGLWGDYFLLEFCCHFVRKKHHAKKPSETACFFFLTVNHGEFGILGRVKHGEDVKVITHQKVVITWFNMLDCDSLHIKTSKLFFGK